MATQAITGVQFVRSGTGMGPPEIGGQEDPWLIETAAQTYKAGDLVYLDTNGTVAICGLTSQQQNTFILGQALKDATGVTGAQTRVRPIRPYDIYSITAFHATQASAVLTQAAVGTVYGIVKKATTLEWCLDIANAVEGSADTLGRLRVVGWPGRGPDGSANTITDIYPRVYVQFLEFSLDLTDSVPFKRVLQWQ